MDYLTENHDACYDLPLVWFQQSLKKHYLFTSMVNCSTLKLHIIIYFKSRYSDLVIQSYDTCMLVLENHFKKCIYFNYLICENQKDIQCLFSAEFLFKLYDISIEYVYCIIYIIAIYLLKVYHKFSIGINLFY